MTEQNKFANRGEDFSSILGKDKPPFWKVGRDAALQLAAVERDLWTDLEERESGNYIISGLTKKVTELDFTAFTFAVGQILYNQSYQSGNEDINSGVSRKKAHKVSKQIGGDAYKGEIVVTLNELCRLAYGVAEPSTENKKKMAALIDTFHKTPVKVKFPNGDEVENYLCVMMGKYTRNKDGAVLYDLYLNPIFGSRIQNQFGELPQDITERLSKATNKKSAAHYLLIRWLSVQDKRCSHALKIGTLVKELRMEEEYKSKRNRADKKLLSICGAAIKVGILSGYDVDYTTRGGKKYIQGITFHLNPNFIRKPKEGKATTPDEPDKPQK